MTTNLSNSTHVPCADSGEMIKDQDSCFDSGICFNKDNDKGIIYKSSENVHHQGTACTDTHYVKKKAKKDFKDDADVLGLESVVMNIGVGNNVAIPLTDCINSNRAAGRTAASVYCVDTEKTDTCNSHN